MNTFYIDGAFVAEDEAALPVTDLAVVRGYAIFDFLRTYNGIPFHLEEHLDRLDRSARLVGLKVPMSRMELTNIIDETLQRNDHLEANVKLVVTGGESVDGITPGKKQRLLVMVTPLKEMPGEWYTDGVGVVTSHTDRVIPGAKSTNYIQAILNLRDASMRDAIESLYVNRFGFLLEGTTSNFFAFIDGRLVTPPENRILPGITRNVVLQLAGREFEIEVRDIHREEIRMMDEAFLSSSNKEIVPVVKIDSIPVGDGKISGQVRRMMELFTGYTSSYGTEG